MNRRNLAMALLCAAVVSAMGCMSGEEPKEERSTGDLDLTWTIGNRTTADLCDAYGAYAAQIVIEDKDGKFVREIEAPCQDFSATIALPPGEYRVFVGFVKEDKTPVGNRIDLGSTRVERGGEQTLLASFAMPPASSR